MLRRVRVFALAGLLSLTVAGTAAAHECYVVNRSDQGDAGALHSQRWARLSLADVFGFIHGVVGGPALTPSQTQWAVAAATAQGLPAEGWVTRIDKTIGAGSSNPNIANGRGLDHLEEAVGAQIVGIYFQALGQ